MIQDGLIPGNPAAAEKSLYDPKLLKKSYLLN